MNSSQKYLLAGLVSLATACIALIGGAIFLYQTVTAPLPQFESRQENLPDIASPTPTSSASAKTGYTQYSNDRYGISFEYPDAWHPENGLTFSDQEIEVSFATNFYKQDSGDFKIGLLSYLNSICSADGPTGSIQCLGSDAKIEQYTNPLGVKGYRIFRIKTNEQILPVKSTRLTPETVYAYPIEDSDAFAIVFAPTLTAKTQPKDLKSVADSLRSD